MIVLGANGRVTAKDTLMPKLVVMSRAKMENVDKNSVLRMDKGHSLLEWVFIYVLLVTWN